MYIYTILFISTSYGGLGNESRSSRTLCSPLLGAMTSLCCRLSLVSLVSGSSYFLLHARFQILCFVHRRHAICMDTPHNSLHSSNQFVVWPAGLTILQQCLQMYLKCTCLCLHLALCLSNNFGAACVSLINCHTACTSRVIFNTID